MLLVSQQRSNTRRPAAGAVMELPVRYAWGPGATGRELSLWLGGCGWGMPFSASFERGLKRTRYLPALLVDVIILAQTEPRLAKT